MRKIAIFYLDTEAWDKALFPGLCPEPIKPDEYRFLLAIDGPQAAEMDLEQIWVAMH